MHRKSAIPFKVRKGKSTLLCFADGVEYNTFDYNGSWNIYDDFNFIFSEFNILFAAMPWNINLCEQTNYFVGLFRIH